MIMMTAMLAASTVSFAQSNDGWKALSVSYNPVTLEPKHGDNLDLTGVSLVYSKAFKITNSLPLYVEAGVGAQYTFGTDDSDKTTDDLGSITFEQKYSIVSAKVPVNVMYAFEVPNSKITIAPFAGVTANLNLLATRKADVSLTGMYADMADLVNEFMPSGWDDSKNMFDKDDMGDSDNCLNRFVLGGQIGANVYFGNYYVGGSYGFSLTDALKDVKQNVCSITLGMKF